MITTSFAIVLSFFMLGIGWVLGVTWNAFFGHVAEQEAYDKGWRDRAEIEKRNSASKL